MARSEANKVERKAAREPRLKQIEDEERLYRERVGHGPYTCIFCYRCHKEGHYAYKCPEKQNLKVKITKKVPCFRPEINCFKCKEKGHFIDKCPKIKKKPGAPSLKEKKCYHCKLLGHIARECTERQKGRQALLRPARAETVKLVGLDGHATFFCKKCSRWGHVTVECPSPPEEGNEVKKTSVTSVEDREDQVVQG